VLICISCDSKSILNSSAAWKDLCYSIAIPIFSEEEINLKFMDEIAKLVYGHINVVLC